MNIEELLTKIKGLEGLVEAQRETIRDLSEKNIKANVEMKEMKRQYEDKRKFMFHVWVEDCLTDETFQLNFSEKEIEVILKFIKTVDKKYKYLHISIYKEVYGND